MSEALLGKEAIMNEPKTDKVLWVFVFFFFVIGGGLIYIFRSSVCTFFRKTDLLSKEEPAEVLVAAPRDPSVILKVGEEEIFQQDYDREVNAYPAVEDKESLKEKVIDKLVTDSVILQAGRKERAVSLDVSVFNSKNKDYMKRIELVRRVKNKIGREAVAIRGSIVSIWFVNIEVGSLGYEKSKEIAWAKIKPLYDAVKAGEMTMKNAGDVIVDDEALAQIDPSYKGNAYREFKGERDDLLTLGVEFNKELWGLEPGEMTGLCVVKDQTEMGEVEAIYKFGQVEEKRTDGKIASFKDWLNKSRKIYGVVYY